MIAVIRGMKRVTVTLEDVGALGAITTGFKKYVSAIEINMKVENAQKNSVIGIFRLVLGDL